MSKTSNSDVLNTNVQANDLVRNAFDGKDLCTVLICSSSQNSDSQVFPIYKKRREGSKVIESICLITTVENTKRIPITHAEAESALVNSYFNLKDRNEDTKDSLVKISNDFIMTYDKNMKV